MKKIFFILIILIGSGITTIAQDVIVTKDGKKITSKVVEVNENDIRYKLFENQSGPTYFLKKSEIASILYESGHVDVFNLSITTTPSQSDWSTQKYTQYDLRNAKVLRNTGVSFFTIGMAFTFAIGLPLYLTSYDYYYYYDYDYYYDYGQEIAGIVFYSIGSAMTIPGIVMWAVGQSRMNHIRRLNPNGFSLFENEKLQLNVAVGGNSMGLKLNF